MLDDAKLDDEEMMILTLAMLMIMPPEHRDDMVPFLRGRSASSQTRGLQLVEQYSPRLESDSLLERATNCFHKHWAEANTAATYEIMTQTDKIRWDRGERHGFEQYSAGAPNGLVTLHLIRRVEEQGSRMN